jgi:hypothetical protein
MPGVPPQVLAFMAQLSNLLRPSSRWRELGIDLSELPGS